MTDRQWTDADRDLVLSVLRSLPPPPEPGTIGCLGPTAPELAGRLLDALTAAGWRPADAPCNMTHTPPFDFAQCETHDETFPLGAKCRFDGREMWEVFAEEADQQRQRAVRAEMDMGRLDELVATLEQQLVARSCRMCHGSHLVHDGMGAGPCPACDVDARQVPGWERWYCGTSADRWELPPEPTQTSVWDRLGVHWSRDPDDIPAALWWPDTPPDSGLRPRQWPGLLARGPLSPAPPETAGGERPITDYHGTAPTAHDGNHWEDQ